MNKIMKRLMISGLVISGVVIAFGLSSCNLTRTITTQSQYYQKGDTSVMIQTKVTESYDASKKM